MESVSYTHLDVYKRQIGITGTTGNIDPNNADSMQGVVYFCIRVKDKEMCIRDRLSLVREDRDGRAAGAPVRLPSL